MYRIRMYFIGLCPIEIDWNDRVCILIAAMDDAGKLLKQFVGWS